MLNLKEECKLWAKKTFKETLDAAKVHNQYPDDVISYTREILKRVKKYDKCVDGYASEGLPKTQEQHTGITLKYSEIFHDLLDQGRFNPVNFILELVSRGSRIREMNEENFSLFIGFISRGIRTLTSLMREPDFAERLKEILKHHDSSVTTDLNHEQDSKDHTDVLLSFNNKHYRIWLYQFSPRGLPHDIERVTGKRGELLSGLHVLCPLDTQCAYDKKIGAIEKKIKKLKSYVKKKEDELSVCTKRAVKRRENLINDIQLKTERIKTEEIKKAKSLDDIKDELEVYEGWFFYSEQHIQRVADNIIGKTPDCYSEIKEKLLFPEQYLGNTNIIEV